MATEKQIAANRANAQLSTGPRTEAGKAASSQNATSHSLTAKGLIVLPHLQPHFDAFAAALRADLSPSGATQEMIFNRILECAWNLERCRAANRQFYEITPNIEPLTHFASQTHFDRIQRYTKENESSMYKAMRELGKLQSEKQYRIETFPVTDEQVTNPENAAPSVHSLSAVCSMATVVKNMLHCEKSNKKNVPTPVDDVPLMLQIARENRAAREAEANRAPAHQPQVRSAAA